MANVHSVAKFFLSLCEEDAGDVISNLKLQKLVYYAQGFHLAVFGRPLFDDAIEAWTHGPVVPNLYHAYKPHAAAGIPPPTDFNVEELEADSRELLHEVYRVYGQYSAWKLRNMTHDEAPWIHAYQIGPGAVISQESMQEYFKTQLQ